MGYAKLRKRPANGNSHSSVLKPVAKKKSHIAVWVGVPLLLLVAGGAVLCLCLSPEGEVQGCREVAEKGDAEATHNAGRLHVKGKGLDKEKPKAGKSSGNVKHFVADEKDTEVQKNVRVRQDEGSKPSVMALDLGDFSNLQDTRFCRQHGLDETKVSADYDVHRRANVHRYAPEAQYIKMPYVSLRMIVQYVECSNRIVEKTEIYVMNAKGEKGTAEFQRGNRAMATVVVDEISELSALSSEGNPIVASSPNIMYRGYNKKLVNDSLVAAVYNVIKNHGGVVAIQWKTPKCFVSWHFLAMNEVYTVINSRSDQIIRTNVFGNE